jgi:tetratricopeptide (TPR) repeat protein
LIEEMRRRAEARGPDRFAALLALAGVYEHDGRLDEAAATYEQASSEAPGSAVAELALARLFAERGDHGKARERYERALVRVKDPAEREQIQRTLMTLALDVGDVLAAKKHHAELVRLQKGSFFVRAELGRELLVRGMYPQAVEELASVVKAGSGDNRVLAPALRDYGKALVKVGRRQEALTQLSRALAVAGAQAGVRREIYETIVELYRAEDRLPALIADLERRGARDAEEQRILASLYEETGKLDRALAAHRAVLRRDPKDIGTRLKAIHILEVQGQLDEAVREYEALTVAAPRNPDFVFRLAEALIQRGDRAEALAQLRRLEARSGDDDEVLAALVDFYERFGEKATSLALLQRLSARGAGDPQHLVELGSRYWKEGDKKKALATWQRIRAVSTDRIQGLLTLGELYLEHDLIAEALATLEEAVRLEPKQIRLRRALALALERAGTSANVSEGRQLYHDQALTAWEQILRESANSPQLAREARQHIVTLWSLAGSLAPRAAGLERRLKATPPDLEAGRLLAEAEIRLRRHAEAERTLRTVVEAAPGDLESLGRLERVLGMQRKLGEAIQVLERLARADPKRAREYYQRMADYSAELYRDDDAIRYASRSVELSPDDAEGHKKLGEMQRKRGDVAKAIASFRMAIAKNERLFPVYFELAELLLGQGQPEEADGLLRRVVRASPDEELIVRAARLSLQVGLGKGSVESLERDLLPLALDNPDRPVYRRLLVELYGALAYPLLHRAASDDGPEAREAEAELRRLGERAVKPLLDALSDPRDTQQETATTLLTYVANQSAGPALFAYATGGATPRLRARAMLALGALKDPSLAPKLGELLAPGGKARAEESDPVLLAAAWSLCKLSVPAARAPLTALSSSPAPGLRAFGALGLALLGDRRAAPTIGRVLTATDAGSLPRAAAAFAVGELGLAQYASVLSELIDAPDPALRSAALVSLARVAPATAPDRIARLLLSPDPEVRPAARAAALVLATGAYRRSGQSLAIPTGEVDVAQVLARLLPDAYDSAEEQAALERLSPALERSAAAAVRGSPEGARAVADALSNDGGRVPFSALLALSAADAGTRSAAERLASRIAASTVPAFVSLAGHPGADVRSFALAFLAKRTEPDAVRAVVAAVSDPDTDVRRAVLSHLGSAHAGAADAVIALAHSQLWSDRTAAAEALGRICRDAQPEKAVLELERLATRDATALVREAALGALLRAAPRTALRVLPAVRDSDPEPHVRRTARALLESSPQSPR